MKFRLTLTALIVLSVTAFFLLSDSSENLQEISSGELMMPNVNVVAEENVSAVETKALMSSPIPYVPTGINDIDDPLIPDLAIVEKSTQEELDLAVEALSEALPPSERALKAIWNAKPSQFMDAMPQELIDAEARPQEKMTQEQIQEAYDEFEKQRASLDS